MKKIILLMCLCLVLTACNKDGEGVRTAKGETTTEATTTLPVRVTEMSLVSTTTAPPPPETTTTTVPTAVTEETTTEETTTEETTSIPVITYPSDTLPSQTAPPRTVYVYLTETTTAAPKPKPDPTEKELLNIAKQGFAGILYSDDERILNYTNVSLYCMLVGSYDLDPVNDKNTADTIDLKDARSQFRSLWTDDLTTVRFTKVLGKMTKGELQAYNKKVRQLYSGGDVLNITTGFPYEAVAAYKIKLSYDLIESKEHVYEETPYVLVVNYDDYWVFDMCYPLLEETNYRTNGYNTKEELRKAEEEREKAEEEAQKKAEEELKKAQEEAKKKNEEAQKEAEERQKKIEEYNKAYSERLKARSEWNVRVSEFTLLKNDYLDTEAEYEVVYAEFMDKLKNGYLDKDDSEYLYYTNYIRTYETTKRKYEQEKTKFENEQKKYNQEEEKWETYLYDFYKEMGWSWNYSTYGAARDAGYIYENGVIY